LINSTKLAYLNIKTGDFESKLNVLLQITIDRLNIVEK